MEQGSHLVRFVLCRVVEWNRILISFGSYYVVWLSGTGFSSCGLVEQGSHLVRFVFCRVVERNRVLISFGSYSVVWLRGTGFSSRSVRILSCG